MILPSVSSFGRRRFLGTVVGAGATALLVGCGNDGSASTASSPATSATSPAGASTPGTTGATTTAGTGSAAATPGETGGPFPADGTNDNGEGVVANVLEDARSVRSDIRANLDGSDAQDGVPFELTTTVVDTAGAPLAGAAVYIWHCNRAGEYSQYNSPMLGGDFTDVSWLRGVQVTDANGHVQFTTILPGRYQGRAFHIHFEVYADDSYGNLMLTSQMAMDDDQVDTLYSQASGYETALHNDTNNSQDNIFRDGVEQQLLTVTGDTSAGLQATFTAVV